MQGVALEGGVAVTATLSRVLAAAMLYPGDDTLPYEENRDTTLILRDRHPDVQVIAGEKAGSITVDAVRAMQREAHIKPNQAPGRVFILQNASAMTPQAQNALLKIVETPPAGVRFIFTVENRHHLLPTVQSRLVIAPVEAGAEPLPVDFPERAAGIARIAGDWQRVIGLLGDKSAMQLFVDCADALDAIQAGNAYGLMVLFAGYEKKREDFLQFCLCLRSVCAHHLIASGGEAPRLLRATVCLAQAADEAGHNVFLPMLGCYMAGSIFRE